MEPVKRQPSESNLDFLRRIAANPGAVDNWGDVAPTMNGLTRDEIPEAEKILAVDPSTRDRAYPTQHVFKAARDKFEAATANRGRAERLGRAKQLAAEASEASDPKDVEDKWRELTDTFKTSSLQRQALADDLGLSYRPGMADAALSDHFRSALAPAKERAASVRAAARVAKLYDKPKDFGLTKRDLPKTPPADARVDSVDARQDVRTGAFPGAKKGDVVTIQGRPHVVLAASGVMQMRDPELGLLGRRQHLLTQPATADQADAAAATEARERWAKRAKPFDDYNTGGHLTDAQRVEAEEWLRRYEADPVAAIRAERNAAK